MQIISWILIIIAAGVAAYGTMMLLYFRRFAKQSVLTVGTITGQEFAKRGKGVYPVVSFKAGKRHVSTKAVAFEKNMAIAMGQKVNLRYLETAPSPQKWDVRIISKGGYGKKRTMKIVYIGYAISAVLLAAGIALQVIY